MKSYKEIIRGLREDSDLTQTDIANILGTTQQHYSKYEKGENELPIRALMLLADHYGVSTDYLLGRTECKDGVDGLNKSVDSSYSAGGIISDLFSLDAKDREKVVEYLYLQKMKEALEKQAKDGR